MPTSINLTGDLLPVRDEADSLFDHARPYLEEGVSFGQLETCLSERGRPRRDVLTPMRVPPDRVTALTDAGYDIVSFAGNNNLDYGDPAFTDTLELLDQHAIEVVGAGMDLEAARAPVYVERDGVRIGFVSFCSILRQGYEATATMPGIAPLEVMTFYQPNENIREQPGTPARTVTVPVRGDYEAAIQAVEVASENADVVVASFHWGVHFSHDPSTYQADVGYAAVEAGADLVVGTHPHVLQAVDTHNGAPIFYSLGNFAFELPPTDAVHAGATQYRSYYGLDEKSPISRETMLIHCDVDQDGVQAVRIRPGFVNDHLEPVFPDPTHARFQATASLLTKLSAEFGVVFERDDDVLRVDHDASDPVDARAVLHDRKVSYPSGFVRSSSALARPPE